MKRFEPVEVNLLGKKFIAPDGPSFYYSFKEIFDKEIYQFYTENEEPIIIDCGSNCGLSILYFSTLYPNSHIIGFEPDPRIFDFLKKNMESFGLGDVVEIHNNALWNENKILEFNSCGGDSGSILNGESSLLKVMVETITLSGFLKGREIIDLLKIDIEGSEIAVLKECEQYLYKVQRIFIEYHSFKNKNQELDVLLSILKRSGFRVTIHTEMAKQKPFNDGQSIEGPMDLQLNIFGVRSQ